VFDLIDKWQTLPVNVINKGIYLEIGVFSFVGKWCWALMVFVSKITKWMSGFAAKNKPFMGWKVTFVLVFFYIWDRSILNFAM
jgi:hypothetical protein